MSFFLSSSRCGCRSARQWRAWLACAERCSADRQSGALRRESAPQASGAVPSASPIDSAQRPPTLHVPTATPSACCACLDRPRWPSARRAARRNWLPGENVLAGLEVDLDDGLRFRRGLLVVTDRRLLAREPGERLAGLAAARPGWRCATSTMPASARWNCTTTQARLARWRFTLGAQPAGAAAGRRSFEQRSRPRRRRPSRRRTTARLQGAAAADRKSARLRARAADAAVDLDAVAPVALRQALPQAAAAGLRADAGLHGRHPGAALPDHAADGRGADSVPERPAHRPAAGAAAARRACWARRCWPGAWAGRAPTSWRWCPSASAPTCAPPPTSTCCGCRWSTSAASAPAT